MAHDEVHVNEQDPGHSDPPPAPPGQEGKWNQAVGTLDDWTREQTASLSKEGLAGDAHFATRPSGLIIYTGDDGPRVYVPEKRRKPLFKWFHETAGHVAAAKTHSLIAKDYYWPHSRRNVRK